MLEYTQGDLAEAARLAPTLGSKAHERIARALAERSCQTPREVRVVKAVARQAGELVRKHVIVEFMTPKERAVLEAALSYPEVQCG